jgi:hypothetical protein
MCHLTVRRRTPAQKDNMTNLKHWTSRAKKLLVGKRITDVAYMTSEEATGRFGAGDKLPLVITFDDGTKIYPSTGRHFHNALFTNKKDNPIIPNIMSDDDNDTATSARSYVFKAKGAAAGKAHRRDRVA